MINNKKEQTKPRGLPLVTGVIAQEATSVYPELTSYSYIAASYVRYIESAGGIALLIRLKKDDDYYKHIFENIHGVLVPGGGACIEKSEYARVSKIFYHLAIEANEKGIVFPIMGICLGFEQLLYLASDKNPLSRCRGLDYNTSLIKAEDWDNCQMLKNLPVELESKILSEDICYNNHQYCVRMETYENDKSLKNTFRVGAMSKDKDKKRSYIAFAEARNWPFYAIQWHPEKPLFEWSRDTLTRSRDSVKCAQYLINHFLDKAYQCTHKFKLENFQLLSYTYHASFTATTSHFMECYIFDDSKSDEEMAREDLHVIEKMVSNVNLEDVKPM
ncbi:hypothetical protein ACOME3_002567 [Neoechinorhynchus agilis]